MFQGGERPRFTLYRFLEIRRSPMLRRRWVPFLILPLAFLAGAVGAAAFSNRADPPGLWLVQAVIDRVQAQSLDTAAAKNPYEHAARGLLEQLDDPYADLYSPEQLRSFQRETIGNRYGGLGMSVEQEGDSVLVGRVFTGTPADRVGFQTGDRIVKVDGVDVTGLPLDAVTGRMRGPVGTPVKVTIRRYGSELIEFTPTRAQVHVPAVPFTIVLDGGVGYLPLQRFNEDSREEVRRAMVDLKQKGATSFILDLRGNGGGSLDQAIGIGSLFLPVGQQVVTVKYRDQPDEVSRADGNAVATREPMIVMADEYSASASEIVAGALQDHDRALVVGSTTFGKGLVQSLFQLDEGWALKFTTGRWYTPSGRTIQKPRDRDGAVRTNVAVDSTVYRSDNGRRLAGGGGITPDVGVKPDTMVDAEKEFARRVGAKGAAVAPSLSLLARGLATTTRPGWSVTPAWRDSLFARLTGAGVEITREQYDGARRVADRMIETRVARLVGADTLVFRRDVPFDPALRRAVELLRSARTQAQLYAAAGR
jgi:carboxyl-terminal processing protease